MAATIGRDPTISTSSTAPRSPADLALRVSRVHASRRAGYPRGGADASAARHPRSRSRPRPTSRWLSVRIDDVADENVPSRRQLRLVEEEGSPQTTFQFSLPPLDDDKTLLFTLFDADGIRSREAVRLALAAIADEPPQVGVQLKGIGTAITAAARLPAAGDVSDDYAVARVWFDFHVDDAPPRQQPFAAVIDDREKVSVADALEVRDLDLQPKQKFHLAVKAADSFALEGGPNIGSSQPYVLDVVTPEQLRSMLEARELTLRRRFETVVEELTETRQPVGPRRHRPIAGSGKGQAAPGAREPGDDAKRPANRPRSAAAQLVQVERVLQNGERSAHETLQVALAFDGIREEMVNNRVDTEELKIRLKDGVADPLKRIVDEMFPKWEGQLRQLSGQLSDPKVAAASQAAALAQADAILVELRQVLDKMLELETFNEVLDMLRQIIGDQEKVTLETKQKQKQKLRDLTE